MQTQPKTHFALLNDRFLLLRIIGQGTFACVWMAVDLFPEVNGPWCRKVAVKVIEPSKVPLSVVRQEIQTLSRVKNHPNIIKIQGNYRATSRSLNPEQVQKLVESKS